MIRSIRGAPRAAVIPRRLGLLLAATLIVIGASASPTGTRGQDAPLAEGDAQVIAQGLTAPPAERVAWRVVAQQIPLRADARPSNRMPSAAGFVLADDAPVFIADQDTKRRYRLAPGEAEFVPTGANQTWASLADTAGSVYAIELTDQKVMRDEGTGQILAVGSSFEIAQGDYDLNLIRDVVDGGEAATVTGGEFPVLVFATGGAIDISSTRSEETTRLGRGEGLVLRGDISIEGRGDVRSTYVAAVIGDAVTGGQADPTAVAPEETATTEPAESAEPTSEPDPAERPEPERTPEPAATPEGSSVRIAIRICRDGISVDGLNPRACQRADGNYRLALVTPDGTRLRLNDAARVGPSFVRWSGLEPGQYALVIGDLPSGYVTYSLDGFACCPFEGGYPIFVSEDVTIDGTLYLLQDFPPPPAPVVVATSVPAPALPATVVAADPVAGADGDGDGVFDADELNIFGTSPAVVDSDGDTIPDGVEAYGTNGYRTKPSVSDSDGDGVADNIEIQRGTNPTIATGR